MKILVFPKDPNPYQDLLYGKMNNSINVEYLSISRDSILDILLLIPKIFIKLVGYKKKGFRIIHVHWFYTLYINKPFVGRSITFLQIYLFMLILKSLQYKIIWTVHNVVPQDPKTFNDIYLMRHFSKIASAKIIHSPSVKEQMVKYSYDISKTEVIPHGNYLEVYKNNSSRYKARKMLNIKNNDRVILFFGNINSYKGLDNLIYSFRRIHDKNLCLIIAGKCNDSGLLNILNQATVDSRISIYDKFIQNDDVQYYFNAADIVCLPFKTITTSGSVLLALTFGKPIIAPNIGAIQDIPKEVGVLYNPSRQNALEDALIEGLNTPEKLEEMSIAARKYSSTLSWDKIAAKTYRVYEDVLREK